MSVPRRWKNVYFEDIYINFRSGAAPSSRAGRGLRLAPGVARSNGGRSPLCSFARKMLAERIPPAAKIPRKVSLLIVKLAFLAMTSDKTPPNLFPGLRA